MKKQDINWNWGEESEFLGEQLPIDTLDREKYAKFLYEICAARGEKANLIVNINAEWGAGKTYFTKRLSQTISNAHPVVYIDAWKEDFSDDPLLTIFSAIKEQLTGQSDKFTTLLNQTIENIGPLLKTATPLLLNGVMKKLTGVEFFSDLTKDLSTKLLDLHSEKSLKITSIKKGINTWVRYINQEDVIDKKLPIFIIIDELDRCRPNFAISLLEITKHIFNIPGVVFIISTDTEQLQHSIKVIYGNNFSASHYLSRFFDRRFLLPLPNLNDFLMTISASSIVSEFEVSRKKLSPSPPDYSTFINNCASVLQSMKINLRDSIKLFDRLIDIFLTTTKNFDPVFLLILSAVNCKDNELYSALKSKNFDIAKDQISEYTFDLTLDLSQTNTGVTVLDDGQYRRPNKHEIIKQHVNIAHYINAAQSIISIKNASSMVYGNQYAEPWISGGLSTDETLDTFLKIGWASTKSHEISLSLSQYYDLIELSTTFE